VNVENRRLKVYNSFRAELREVAIDIFAKRGFDLVSIRDIAFAAGISERAFSRYYSEKEDILLDGFCEESVGFRKSLMALPRSLLPIDAFEQAILADGQSSIWFEGARAAMLYSPDSRKLRAAFNERGVNWQVKIAEAIAVWLGCSTATDFRPALWASA
jgi:AcrR family transcriptional regulator